MGYSSIVYFIDPTRIRPRRYIPKKRKRGEDETSFASDYSQPGHSRLDYYPPLQQLASPSIAGIVTVHHLIQGPKNERIALRLLDGRRLTYDHGVVVKSVPPSIDPPRPARSRYVTAPDSPFPPLAMPSTHDPFAHGPDHEMEQNDLTVWQRGIQEFHQNQLSMAMDMDPSTGWQDEDGMEDDDSAFEDSEF